MPANASINDKSQGKRVDFSFVRRCCWVVDDVQTQILFSLRYVDKLPKQISGSVAEILGMKDEKKMQEIL